MRYVSAWGDSSSALLYRCTIFCIKSFGKFKCLFQAVVFNFAFLKWQRQVITVVPRFVSFNSQMRRDFFHAEITIFRFVSEFFWHVFWIELFLLACEITPAEPKFENWSWKGFLLQYVTKRRFVGSELFFKNLWKLPNLLRKFVYLKRFFREIKFLGNKFLLRQMGFLITWTSRMFQWCHLSNMFSLSVSVGSKPFCALS